MALYMYIKFQTLILSLSGLKWRSGVTTGHTDGKSFVIYYILKF
jgi:hypothetical protein